MGRTAVLKLLPDGSGRVRIHWFMWDDQGPIQMPQAQIMTARGMRSLGGSVTGSRRGRIVCQPKTDNILPQARGNEHLLFTHTDDPRVATCPECMATSEWKAAMDRLGEIVANAPEAQG